MKNYFLPFIYVFLIWSCSKETKEAKDPDVFNQELHAAIPSPYLEEVLIEKGIDSDGEINQRVLKGDIEGITELVLHLENIYTLNEENDCYARRHSYDIEENSILNGIENFNNLSRLTFTTREKGPLYVSEVHCTDRISQILVEINELNNLEELYVGNYWHQYALLNLKVMDCNILKRIGTAIHPEASNYFFEDNPNDGFIALDETNFSDEDRDYEKILQIAQDDEFPDHLINGSIQLVNLPEMESLSVLQSTVEVNNTNTPKLKKMFIAQKSAFFIDGSTPALFQGIEELYLNVKNYRIMDPIYSGITLNLNSFSDLYKVHYLYDNVGIGNIDDIGMNLQNGTNLIHDLKVILEFKKYPLSPGTGSSGVANFELCLDDSITSDFLENNVTVIAQDGMFNGTDIDTICD